MEKVKDLKKLLKETRKIIEHQEELSIAKGDHFNLFAVLNIETRENRTHSAFLTELLNPKGSHRMGDVFLKHFLTTINHSQPFYTNNAKVRAEQAVGTINLCRNKIGKATSNAKGGRIDIYLKDKDYNIISIENKIHADDQEAQIQRYCNHRTDQNTVYYLTLKGDEPSEFSKLELKSGEHFYNISYRDEIQHWLELCLREVANFTALREAINQYILLIKKLTHTLDNKAEMELFDTMIDYFEESKYVADNYQKLVNTIRENFRKEIIKRLKISLDISKYDVISEHPIDQTYSKIWVHYIDKKHVPFSFCVEPFSGRGNTNGAMFVGLYGHKGAICSSLPNPNKLNDVWKHIQTLMTKSGNNLHLNSSDLLKKLYHSESDHYENLVSTTCQQIIQFIQETEPYLFQDFGK
ncbi:hypothetical protein AAU57_06610 [Nonlabens sp. YIK11]|uniref:PDDEXK-like family protein n=1 Tax=Nonlabens sp. YIK11 TaxID=1453349 RepID=UPI0006DBEFC8|nr:PD-(D/E)XK nuclease family protein [Nonlabens sp. YIK11]KQC33029.1 hypothetical protein AAU57_06610 [Nonlabens sp. YIK11]